MSRRRSPRRLSPAEEALWQRIAADTRPLRPGAPPAPPASAATPEPAIAPPPPSEPAPVPGRIAPFRIGELRGTTAAPPELRATGGQAAPPARIDRKALQRLSRGRIAPDARRDLHGLTLAEAQTALTRFLAAAQAEGCRLVLVITGKGRPGIGPDGLPQPAGALRRAVPLWLASPPLSALVLDSAPAHPRHGGAGALYVWLRRRP